MKYFISTKELSQCIGIGIDVSKDSLAFAGKTPGKNRHSAQVNNTLSDIHVLAKKLVKANYKGNIICESTGHYHLKLVSVFSKYSLNLIVVNPLQSAKYNKANIRKTKSDPVDADGLADMCVTESNLPAPIEASDDNILIRLYMGQLCFLEKFIQRLTRSTNQYQETFNELGFKESEIQLELREELVRLKKLKTRLEKSLEQLIITASSNQNSIQNIQEIPGISSTTAACISQLSIDVKNANSWVAFLGYDTSVRESGQWKGRGRITKRGNRYLRKRLFCAAWGAMMHDEHFKAYYDELRGKGRSYIEALCIIAKKLLRIAYQVMANGKKYDSKLAFPSQ